MSPTIYVEDILEGCKDKVFICKNGRTQSVSVNAVSALLSNGVQLGSCNVQAKMIYNEEVAGEFKVYPNPSSGKFIIEMPHS